VTDGNVPDVAKLCATDGDVALSVDEIVVARDPRASGRRAQITHRLRRLDDVCRLQTLSPWLPGDVIT